MSGVLGQGPAVHPGRLGDQGPDQRAGMPLRLHPPEPAGYPSCEQGEPGLADDKV